MGRGNPNLHKFPPCIKKQQIASISLLLTPEGKKIHFKKTYELKAKTFIPINFDESTGTQYVV